MVLIDAHNHLQDVRFEGRQPELTAGCGELGVREMVVNGRWPGDWAAVAGLAELSAGAGWGGRPLIRPAFGLHPWWVNERQAGWMECLEDYLGRWPGAMLGEVGLDRWIRGADLGAQVECLRLQLRLARRLGLAVTLHCLRAFGTLMEVMQEEWLVGQPFLLHSYGGPAEMVAGWVKLGGYFSVSPYFALERKRAALEVFRLVPGERLLVETDAPDMRPPDEMNAWRLLSADGEVLNDPRNLGFAYELLAGVVGLPVVELAGMVVQNAASFCGGVGDGGG